METYAVDDFAAIGARLREIESRGERVAPRWGIWFSGDAIISATWVYITDDKNMMPVAALSPVTLFDSASDAEAEMAACYRGYTPPVRCVARVYQLLPGEAFSDGCASRR